MKREQGGYLAVENSTNPREEAVHEAEKAIQKAAKISLPQVPIQPSNEIRLNTTLESDRAAEARVIAARALHTGNLEDTKISLKSVEEALVRPGFTKPGLNAANDDFNGGANSQNPNQYFPEHSVIDRAKRVVPFSQIAHGTAREEFGISQKDLENSGIESFGEAAKRSKKLSEIDPEFIQMKNADTILRSGEPALPVTRTVLSPEAIVVAQKEKESRVAFIQQELDELRAKLIALNLLMQNERKGAEESKTREQKTRFMENLKRLLGQQKSLLEQEEIYKKSLRKIEGQ